MACAATRIDTAICPGNGRKADHALRLKPDHLIGAGQVTGEVARFQKEINPATSLTLYRGSLLLSDCFGEKQRCLTILRACYTPTLSFDNFVSSLSSKPSLPI